LTSTRFTNRANGLRLAHFENEGDPVEQTRRANAGLDLEMFRNIVNISLDVYTGTTDNLLTLIKYPEVLGSGYYWYNNGSNTPTIPHILFISFLKVILFRFILSRAMFSLCITKIIITRDPDQDKQRIIGSVKLKFDDCIADAQRCCCRRVNPAIHSAKWLRQ